MSSYQVFAQACLGVEFRDYPGLNNVELLTSEGGVIPANSFILAINSTVILEMTKKGPLIQLDMTDFTEKGVELFLECCYSGNVKDGTLNEESFRDLNKISAVFKVDWISRTCLEFYCGICSKLSGASEDGDDTTRFLFDEAVYLIKERHDGRLLKALNIALKRSANSGLKTALITNVMKCNPEDHVSMLMLNELAGTATPTLYSTFSEIIKSKPKPYKLTGSNKKLLNPVRLAVCLRLDSGVYHSLMDVLQNSVCEGDFGFLFRLANEVSRGSKGAIEMDVMSGDEEVESLMNSLSAIEPRHHHHHPHYNPRSRFGSTWSSRPHSPFDPIPFSTGNVRHRDPRADMF